MVRRLTLALVAAAALLVPPASASGAVFSIGSGKTPDVAIDAAGTAYIAWVGEEPNVTSLQFCRLPRGAAACDLRHAIATEGTANTRPFVTVQGSTVRVLSYRYDLPAPHPFDGDMLYTSLDGGATFGAGKRVGTIPFNDAKLGPGSGISLITSAYSGGMVYQRVPIDDSPPAGEGALLSTTHLYAGAVAVLDGATPLAVYADGAGNAESRRYSGAGEVNQAASWSTAPTNLGYGDRMHLATGPTGTFLSSATNQASLQVRRYDGSTFGAGVAIPNGTGELASSHLVQDAAGRLHLLWPRIDADALRLYYATSDDGVNWQQGTLDTDSGMAGVRTAIAPDNVGVAVWYTAAAGPSEVHVRGGVGPTAVAPQRETVARVPGASITFTTPGSCVPAGGTFKARLKWRKQRRKGNLFIKIKRTDFYVGKRRVKKDRKVPFVHTFRVAVGTQPGVTIRLRARAFIKSHDRKRRTKSIYATVRVCG